MLSSLFKFFTSTGTVSQAEIMAVKELVEVQFADPRRLLILNGRQTAISENKIMIFSKSHCPYCKRAKALFAKEFPDEKPVVFELDAREDGPAIQGYLADKTGQRTVPNIFINKQHVGGNDDTQAAFKTGQLKRLVNEVEA
ncbi:thioredoxin-like protein, partial [Mycena leptocephala]